MAEIDVAAYKEQIFGSNGHANIQPQSPPEPVNEPPAQVDNVIEPTKVEPIAATPTPIVEGIVTKDADSLKEQLGVESWDEAKARFAELDALKLVATAKEEVKFANDQSRALYDALLAGEPDKVYELLDTQKKLSAVGTMSAADAIKLHIQQTNKHFKPLDVEDIFEEKYSYPDKPEKPLQRTDELDEDFVERHSKFLSANEKWQVAKEKIDRRIERDSATAKTELSKLSAELKLPEINKPAAAATNEDELKELQKEKAAAGEFYSKLSPKDIGMVFKFNDEASKLAFDIQYVPEKEGFEEAKELASDLQTFFANYYEKDGSPKRTEFIRDVYAAKNIQKIVSEAIVQAVNQERIRALKFQKNIGDGMQRNYTVQPVSEIQQLKEQVFG